MVPWHESACLVRIAPKPADGLAREILAEGTFAEVARAFGRLHVDEWDQLVISFTERQKPPFRFEAADFGQHVIGRLFDL